MVKGIGPHFAKRLIKAFGEQVFDIIEEKPQRPMGLEGIGKKKGVKKWAFTGWLMKNDMV